MKKLDSKQHKETPEEELKRLRKRVKQLEGKEVKMEVAVGNKVIYSKYAGTEVKLDGEEYIIVKQSDILAIVE